MKTKKSIIAVFLMGFFISVTLSPCIATAQKKKKEEKEAKVEEKLVIPKDVRLILQQGLAQRQCRQDIPLTIFNNLYLPARENVHSIFLFKMTNADLGFTPQAFTVAQEPEEEKKIEKKEETTEKESEKTAPPTEAQTPPVQLLASLNIFLQFHPLKDKEPAEVFKEVYIPVSLQAESTSYDPEKEEVYTTSYPLPPGDYLLAMAVTTLDLQKIGTSYYEFSLPDIQSFTNNLDITPIFFIKKINQMPSPEITAEVHKDYFTYSILQIEPNIENVFSPEENLDIFFFIYGAQVNEEGKYEIEVKYELMKGEEPAVRYAPTTYSSPLISQPLPFKQTVVIKKEGEEERSERKNIEPGLYTLSLTITDKISGKTLLKNIDIEVK